jgi:dienelactone hydrolase
MAAQEEPEQQGGPELAAYVALYPPCWTLIPGGKLYGGPVLVLTGELDELVPVSLCERRVTDLRSEGKDITLKVYPGAHHAWDGDRDGVWYHRAINRSYRMARSAEVTARSRQDVLDFLRRALKL